MVHGVPQAYVTDFERLRLSPLLRALERRGLVILRRDWGLRGYGRPTWIEVTPAGGAEAEPRAGDPSPSAAAPMGRNLAARRAARPDAVGSVSRSGAG